MTPWVRTSLTDFGAGHPDLLVIGGGITGAGIARDAALRGLEVALVEAGDFGGGTSSRSSRLIHGGLRYLEQGRLHLVREALREREILLHLAPHLVHPLPFILPVYRGDRVPRWKIGVGLTLYDWFAGTSNVRRHRTLGKRAIMAEEPLLRERGLTGGARYHDAQCDDARLTLAVVRAAAAAGARVANYLRVTGLLRDGSRVLGARLRDERTGREGEVRARVVVNATGPWSDALRQMEDPGAAPLLRPTKGAHVVVPRSRIGNRQAIIFTSPVDGRVMFILPWGTTAYIGTTDTDTRESPDEVRADADDVTYLLRSANALFPGAHLTEADVRATWAGLRPLLASDPGAAAGALSREHRIVTGAGGMVTIAGGKLTTFRKMAEQVVDRAAKLLGKPAGSRGRSSSVPLPGGDAVSSEGFRSGGLELGLAPETVERLLRQFGGETPAIYALCRERPSLREPLHPEHPAIGAEVVFAARREFAMTVEDVLLRRTRLALETGDGGAAARGPVAGLLEGEGVDPA